MLGMAVLVAKGGVGSAAASPSASVAPSLAAQIVDRIAYTEVRPYDLAAGPACWNMAEGRAVLGDPAGGPPVRLTHGGDPSETNLAWSPDGTQMAFVGGSYPSQAVFLMNVATGQTTNLVPAVPKEVPESSAIGSVSWSPDGTSLVFDWGGQVWVVGTDGTHLQQSEITMPPDLFPTHPVLLPDGRIAALLGDPSARFYGTTLATAPAAGGQLTPVPWLPAGFVLAGMGWSADRSRVAFIGADVSQLAADEWPTWYLYVADADGSDLERLTPVQVSLNDLGNLDPAWSPDGKEIAFGAGSLSIVDAASGEARELPGTPGRAACEPTWGRTTTGDLPQPTPTLAPGATPVPAPFHLGLPGSGRPPHRCVPAEDAVRRWAGLAGHPQRP